MDLQLADRAEVNTSISTPQIARMGVGRYINRPICTVMYTVVGVRQDESLGPSGSDGAPKELDHGNDGTDPAGTTL